MVPAMMKTPNIRMSVPRICVAQAATRRASRWSTARSTASGATRSARTLMSSQAAGADDQDEGQVGAGPAQILR